MEDKKRWEVTYTKHIKQKRKVYHDGYLDFLISTRKVRLYDEADNLLESRILKTDEVVSSGETLTFQAYLVDIGCPVEKNKAASDPKILSSDKKCNRRSFAVLRPNFNKSSLHSEERKSNSVNKIPAKSLSPSQKMIRVFKKREMQKYGAPSPDGVKPRTKGTLPLGSADEEAYISSGHPLTNTSSDGKPCKDSRSETNKLSKSVTSHKTLRDVNQILSFLQRPTTPGNVAEKCSNDNPQTSVSPTKVPSESDTCKSHAMEESVPSTVSGDRKIAHEADIADSSQLLVPESSSGGPYDFSKTHLNDLPSFDLGI
ncbi:PREDICTED: uncharacterized protein LOC104813047 isoform X2 [Tarenaya hassleriana]|uniref:uncharacterized protein LOC104813047 isoform X2 n=1 Tax=Tarenaya hassleriana TaxID=28532 RepID=UPI00053C8D6B|nr:PREDICTED: uncharacterized protein LOC104813047 isoform X2 [Tarenaya hassleriana]